MAEVGQNCLCHDSDAAVGVSVLHNAILHDKLRTLEEAVGNLRKGHLNQDVFDPALYNLRMKDSDSVQAHLNEYESISSQITLSCGFSHTIGKLEK